MRALHGLFFPVAAMLLGGACAGAGPSAEGDPSGGPGVPAAPGTSPPATTTATTPPPPPAPTGPRSGVLLFATDAPIAGAAYESGAGKGTTDAAGRFTYAPGEPVHFRLGAEELGAPAGADAISPYQLAGSATCDETPALVKLVARLQSLDTDANPANGITLPAAAPSATPATPSDADAVRAFIQAFDGEAWTTIGTDDFSGAQAITRGQGMTTDGTSWFFSGTTGLEKTDASYGSMASNVLAIPIGLAIAGSDHIGDIDFWAGQLYAPIEDKSYKAPKVVLYDPNSLSSGTVFDVPVALQTKGVPWIAVDGPRGVAYMAEWDPTPAIHVFALASLAYTRSIDLATVIGRVQGGKVYKGQLYLSSDDAQKTVYKVHLASGTVTPVFALGLDVELEGLAFFARADGSRMHTLNVNAARNGSELRHHRITREPLRWKVCP